MICNLVMPFISTIKHWSLNGFSFLQKTWCIYKVSKHLHIVFQVHYSPDFAQQLHYPHNPMQQGPIFFKKPCKCSVFGIVTEGLPQMAILVLDETIVIAKGANCVINLLDYFF